MLEQHKQVAVVTGGTSGIGLAVTRQLAGSGASVFLCARDPDNVELTVKQLREDGLDVDGVAADVLSSEDVRAFVDAAVSRFGPVDIVVNNAVGNY